MCYVVVAGNTTQVSHLKISTLPSPSLYVLEPYHSSSFSFCLSSSLSQTGLRFCDCNHIVEFVFVEFVSATYRLSSKKTRKGKSPGKGGNRFWKSIVLGFKTPREAIEGMSLFYVNDENPLFSGLSLLSCFETLVRLTNMIVI
ncbi:40S ribosomal protein S11 [Glycine max]|nr:40S ribosomal protein S11 [Glycine max]